MMMEVKTFRPTDFIRGKNGSISLKEELQKYDIQELKKIYDTFTSGTLNVTKEIAIDQIVHHALAYCNMGMCSYNDNDKDKRWSVEMPYS